MLKFILLILFTLAHIHFLFGQSLGFDRKINPFSFLKENGQEYDSPFIGGFNTPRLQFIDIDGDDDKDLFVQEIDDKIIYYENTATPPAYNFIWRTDDWLKKKIGAWFRFADIDNDGDIDLFSQGEQEFIRYFVNLNSTFTVLQDTLLDSAKTTILSELTSIPEFYDIDCDGDLDLFLGRQSGTINFYENISNPKDKAPVFKFITKNYQDIVIIGGGLAKGTKLHGANSLSFGDLNNDGAAELLYGDFFSRSLYAFANNGNCPSTELIRTSDTFPDAEPLDTGGFNIPDLVDIDNDGDLDLFVTVQGGFVSFTQNTATNFYFYENYGTADSAEHVRITDMFIDQFDAGENAVPAFVDIDADGDLDLFVGNSTQPGIASAPNGQLFFIENIGTASSPRFQIIDRDYLVVQNMYDYAPTFGDLDNDGDFDLLIGRNNGKLAYFENKGTPGTPQFELIDSRYNNIDVGALSVPALADLDGDLDLDLVIGEFDGNLNYYENIGDVNTPQFELKSGSFAGINNSPFAKPSFFDFDMDGDFDLLIGSDDGGISFYENNSSESNFIFQKLSDKTIYAQAKASPVMADLKNTGRASIMAGAQGGGLYYFEAKETNSIVPAPKNSGPKSFIVSPNFPNPFNGETHLTITLNKPGKLKITIFDLSGHLVKIVTKAHQNPGTLSFNWDSSNSNNTTVASGIYYLTVNFDLTTVSRKLLLLK